MSKWIKIAIVFIFVSVSLWRCGTETDYDVPGQDSIFRTFLRDIEAEYVPALAAQYGIYKVDHHKSGSGITTQRGDTVSISYSGFTFDRANRRGFGLGSIFTTNIETDALSAGWQPNELLPVTPVSYVSGNGEILRGLDLGIENSAAGDSLRLYLTSDFAYGGNSIGYLAPGTPVVFKVYVNEIKKRR